ncbi:type 1 glutamine amidotransferase [Microbulbifer sp. SSSA008]|uniref:type 1 glutamine amidotransferase n=1 Tax=unclassified Microbulbifer TaxID=2619833 RepID=UPI0024ACAC39|nr:type 1 glutamine amidotransferase [Microbulbifer sp. VAAF005]WHI47960.1 type 1 glutamine amidotransferase [Microbulbifer sp. VAAF005]
MTKPILIIQHEETEGPGYIYDWATEKRIPLSIINPQKSPLPQSDFSGVIILGGMMNVCERERLPWLANEIAWVKNCIELPIPILGICLGAQILAYALEAEVRQLPQEEMGWLPIRSTTALNFNLENVFQAHSYFFEIPEGAICLAESDLCPHQAFIFGKNVLGLQFHLEWSQTDVAKLFPEHFKIHGSPEALHRKGRNLLFQLLDAHFTQLNVSF